jgi:hypothetical protein
MLSRFFAACLLTSALLVPAQVQARCCDPAPSCCSAGAKCCAINKQAAPVSNAAAPGSFRSSVHQTFAVAHGCATVFPPAATFRPVTLHSFQGDSLHLAAAEASRSPPAA